MELEWDPMVVWLGRDLELTIERGDTLGEVASAVEKHWALESKKSRQLVAFWFALGERRAKGDTPMPWTKKELDANPRRRYLAA